MSRRRFSYVGPVGRRTFNQSGRARSMGTTSLTWPRPRERGRSTSPGISNTIGESSLIWSEPPRRARVGALAHACLRAYVRALVAALVHRHGWPDVLQPVADRHQESRGGRAVDHAVIEADDY